MIMPFSDFVWRRAGRGRRVFRHEWQSVSRDCAASVACPVLGHAEVTPTGLQPVVSFRALMLRLCEKNANADIAVTIALAELHGSRQGTRRPVVRLHGGWVPGTGVNEGRSATRRRTIYVLTHGLGVGGKNGRALPLSFYQKVA